MNPKRAENPKLELAKVDHTYKISVDDTIVF